MRRVLGSLGAQTQVHRLEVQRLALPLVFETAGNLPQFPYLQPGGKSIPTL